MKRLLIGTLLVLFVTSLTTSFALAATYRERLEAQKLAREARLLVRKGDFKEAAERLKKADTLVPAPSYKVELAKVYLELGQLVQANEILREAAAVQAQQFVERQAVKKAIQLLTEVEDRTPSIEVLVKQPDPSEVTITIDGADFEPADGQVRYNPGRYELVAEAPGYEKLSKSIKLKEGEHRKVTIALTKIGGDEEKDDDDGGSGFGIAPAMVAWGAGVAGLAVGIAFGTMAIEATNDVILKYGCENYRCPAEAMDDLNTAKLNGNISTAGFIVAGTGAVLGLILFLLADDDEEEVKEGVDKESVKKPGEGDGEDEEAALPITIRPIIAPTYLGVSGTF
jgi:tetratricopeptide (TPR) repeat protein